MQLSVSSPALVKITAFIFKAICSEFLCSPNVLSFYATDNIFYLREYWLICRKVVIIPLWTWLTVKGKPCQFLCCKVKRAGTKFYAYVLRKHIFTSIWTATLTRPLRKADRNIWITLCSVTQKGSLICTSLTRMLFITNITLSLIHSTKINK